ncbi:exosome non-catalytic core subunit rrp46 [Tulasnella sp. 403]|nr:exosome non-catalytic core subunit rrp46 [Tulasnella sp. 403]
MTAAVRPRRTSERAFDELRKMTMEWGGLARVDGSARFAFGPTKAVASVSGPIEVRLNAELPMRATLEVIMRPLAGASATPEKHYAKNVRDVLEQVLVLNQHPRSLVQLVIQALSAVSTPQWNKTSHTTDAPRFSRMGNPSLLAACVNAASLACLNAASVPMRGTLCAVAVGKRSPQSATQRQGLVQDAPELVLDPEEDESHAGWAVFAFVFGATFSGDQETQGCEPIWVDCVGLSSENDYRAAKALAYKGAQEVLKFFRQELERCIIGESNDTQMDLS